MEYLGWNATFPRTGSYPNTSKCGSFSVTNTFVWRADRRASSKQFFLAGIRGCLISEKILLDVGNILFNIKQHLLIVVQHMIQWRASSERSKRSIRQRVQNRKFHNSLKEKLQFNGHFEEEIANINLTSGPVWQVHSPMVMPCIIQTLYAISGSLHEYQLGVSGISACFRFKVTRNSCENDIEIAVFVTRSTEKFVSILP